MTKEIEKLIRELSTINRELGRTQCEIEKLDEERQRLEEELAMVEEKLRELETDDANERSILENGKVKVCFSWKTKLSYQARYVVERFIRDAMSGMTPWIMDKNNGIVNRICGSVAVSDESADDWIIRCERGCHRLSIIKA